MIDVDEHATSSAPIPSLAWVTGCLADRGAEPRLERRRRAEKAEAVGHLAGGLVHDFNNMLGVILGNLERVRRLLPEDAITSRCLADALTATDCAIAFARRLLALVRQQALQPQVVAVDRLLLDLKPLINRLAELCGHAGP